METARLRYPEKVKGLDLEGLECRQKDEQSRVSKEDGAG